MRVEVEVGGWEHECCGPAYERDEVVELTCRVIELPDGRSRHVVVRHGPDLDDDPRAQLRGRVAELLAVHGDGRREEILRVPSGEALRGFDDVDDGHLETPLVGRARAAHRRVRCRAGLLSWAWAEMDAGTGQLADVGTGELIGRRQPPGLSLAADSVPSSGLSQHCASGMPW